MSTAQNDRRLGTVAEVFVVFLRLGLTSFGGPIAHLGYFREAFVVRRRWLGEEAYADLVALCQFLPGPASSQVGMAIGLQRAGARGLVAAWCGFTLPSAIALAAFSSVVAVSGDLTHEGWLLGLMAAAVAVVAQAVLGMARTLAPDARRASIAAASAIAVLLVPGALVQLAVIVGAGVAGLLWTERAGVGRVDAGRSSEAAGRDDETGFAVPVPRAAAVAALATFGVLLVALPTIAVLTSNGTARLVADFFRTGALVFGGGHVVLPLLDAQTVGTGMVGQGEFLAGYGAAQAMPGPLFTFSAYLGALDRGGPGGVLGAALALVAVFLPSALLVIGALPFWQTLRTLPGARRALAGVNAGVVGLLGAALYDPVFTEGIGSGGALALAIAAFVALLRWAAPPWAVVVAAGLIGALAL
ncbi:MULTISPECIES: chromate efflux transporter [unclassified Rathayibacter]|uniref:chromate efflux transporter n=1 Tax=unclassified Rathayibacter TaxID=2609250 RepID=UPI002B26EB0E|nr:MULTISPECIES: chromate efflux transporter [unclassified Rathayibacter]